MRRLLLADDGPAIQKIVRLTYLDHAEIDVVCVGDGDEALRSIDDVVPDIVLADVHMPGASGYEVCRRVKSRAPHVPVILLVGNLEAFDEASAESCGADGHLRKPFEGQELVRRIEAAEARSRESFARTAPIPVFAAADVEPPADEPAVGEPPSDDGAPSEKESVMSDELQLSDEQVDRIARRVVELLTDEQVRKVAWEVVPDMAEIVVRERIRELESQVEEL